MKSVVHLSVAVLLRGLPKPSLLRLQLLLVTGLLRVEWLWRLTDACLLRL